MPNYEPNETSLRGTRETKQRRKSKWGVRLLKGAFWTAWAAEKFYNFAKWLVQMFGD